MIYQKYVIKFNNIIEFMRSYTESGDWIIPCSSDNKKVIRLQGGIDDEKYNPQLVTLLRRQDSKIILKNTKMLGGEDRGLLNKIESFLDGINCMITKIPNTIEKKISKVVSEKYDNVMRDTTTGHLCRVFIWFPVYRIESDFASIVKLFNGRINIIIS